MKEKERKLIEEKYAQINVTTIKILAASRHSKQSEAIQWEMNENNRIIARK